MRATFGGGLAHLLYFEVGLAGLDGLVGDTSEVLATPTLSIEGRGGLSEFALIISIKEYNRIPWWPFWSIGVEVYAC